MSAKGTGKTKGKGNYTVTKPANPKAGEWGFKVDKAGAKIVLKEPKAVYESPLLSNPKIGHETFHDFVKPARRQSAGEKEAELADQLVTEIADAGSDVKALCETYQIRREELGRLTGFSLRALAEWAGGKLPSQPAKRRLQEVRRLLDALAGIVKTERIPVWLHQPNPAFDRLTPLQVIELGEMDRLWAMVYDLGSGQLE